MENLTVEKALQIITEQHDEIQWLKGEKARLERDLELMAMEMQEMEFDMISCKGADEAMKEKLRHYANHTGLQTFIQYDCFHESDDIWGGSHTDELMYGSDVRLLIKPGASKKAVIKSLKELKDIIKRDGLPTFEPETIRTPSLPPLPAEQKQEQPPDDIPF